MANSVESFGYIKCYSSSSPDLLQALAILSDTTVRRSAVDREDLKPNWKAFLRSFSCKRNRAGPNIDSWKTPHFETGFRCGSTSTYDFLFYTDLKA